MPKYEVQETVRITANFDHAITTASGTLMTPGGANRQLTPVKQDNKTYYANYLASGEGEHEWTMFGYSGGVAYVESGTFTVVEFTYTDLDYLIPSLRRFLGDIDPDDYTFSKELLRNSLLDAVKVLGRRWRRKYKVDSEGNISRNSKRTFKESAPPTIEFADEAPIVVQAAIIIKSAELKNSTWDLQSWRDDEIQYSNLGAGRTARDMLDRDEELLDELLNGKLYGTSRQALEGFRAPYNFREGYA
jgi:hypothetical protein